MSGEQLLQSVDQLEAHTKDGFTKLEESFDEYRKAMQALSDTLPGLSMFVGDRLWQATY